MRAYVGNCGLHSILRIQVHLSGQGRKTPRNRLTLFNLPSDSWVKNPLSEKITVVPVLTAVFNAVPMTDRPLLVRWTPLLAAISIGLFTHSVTPAVLAAEPVLRPDKLAEMDAA